MDRRKQDINQGLKAGGQNEIYCVRFAEFLNFSTLAPIILGLACYYPGVVIYKTRPAVTEIQVFYAVQGVCIFVSLY